MTVPAPPHAGSEFFEITLSSALPNQFYYLLRAAMPANVPLGGGCYLGLEWAAAFGVFSGTTDASGRLSFPAPLPQYLSY